MRVRKKKTLLDQASEYVETMRPQVESAASTAREAVQDFVETTARPALQDARAKAGPALAEARERTAAALADAREAAGPAISDARTKAAPVVAAGAAKASKKAQQAREKAQAAAAQARGEQPKKGGKLKKFALFAAVAGAVGFVANKLRGGKESDNWQSSYVPTPAPSSNATPVATTPTTDDPGGSSPDEAIADATEEPHAVTTPDDPATLVDVEDGAGEEPRP